MNIESIARTIRRRRRDLGVDQRTLADLSGISVHTISDVESGKGNPTVETLEAMLEPLGLELVIRVRTTGSSGGE